MARMSIDDMFLRDPRITRLARALNVSRFDARGRLLEVIGIVYDRVDDLLTVDDIDTAAEVEGFAQRMIECDLAVPTRGKLRVRGATERIQYLRTREESGRAGGIKSGESRRKRHEAKSKVTFEGTEAPLNPPDPVPVPVLPPVPDLVLDPPPPNKKVVAPPRDTSLPGYAETVALFYRRFESAYQFKPSWGKGQGSNLKRLLSSHGATEVQRRIAILFDSPPSWLKPPFDFGTFVQHFDKLVMATVAVSRATGRVEPKQPDEYPEGDIAL